MINDIKERALAVRLATSSSPEVPIQDGKGWITERGTYIALTFDEVYERKKTAIKIEIDQKFPLKSLSKKLEIAGMKLLNNSNEHYLSVNNTEKIYLIGGQKYFVYKI
jgi:glutamyl/glutaminyl-tRNA synthetase